MSLSHLQSLFWRPNSNCATRYGVACRLSLLVLCCILVSSIGTSPYDRVCSTPGPIRKNGGATQNFLTVGIAFFPGGTATDWGPAYSYPDWPALKKTNVSMNPCDPIHKSILESYGVFFAYYNTRVDKLSLLKHSFAETMFMLSKSVTNTTVMSLVAFRGNTRSEAIYTASMRPDITGGTGFVTSLGLIAKFESGILRYLQWFDLTCNDCGGEKDVRCITRKRSKQTWHQRSCATPLDACICEAVLNEDNSSTTTNSTTNSTVICNYSDKKYKSCETSVNMAYDGADKDGRALNTAASLRRLNDYSIVGVFATGISKYINVKQTLTNKFTNNWQSFTSGFAVSQGDFVDNYSTDDSRTIAGTGGA